jgi:hypothetical protein
MVTTGTLATLIISVMIVTVRTSISTHLTINDYHSYQNSLHVMSAILAYFNTNWNSWTNCSKKQRHRILWGCLTNKQRLQNFRLKLNITVLQNNFVPFLTAICFNNSDHTYSEVDSANKRRTNNVRESLNTDLCKSRRTDQKCDEKCGVSDLVGIFARLFIMTMLVRLGGWGEGGSGVT